MEWLKVILESAAMKEDGTLDVESTLKSITVEFPKHAVPKTDYNDKIKELKTAESTLETLKKENEGNVELQAKITDYETKIGNLQKQNEETQKRYALVTALKDSGCTDPEYMIYKQGGVEKFAFGEDGAPIGLEDVIKPYKAENKILFPTGQKQQNYNPIGGGGSGSANPFSKEAWNMTEQGRLYKENPENARALAQAAGANVNI